MWLKERRRLLFSTKDCKMKNKIIIIGYDPEIIEMILNEEKYSIEGYVDVNNANNDHFNLKYFGTDEVFTRNYSLQKSHKVTITIDDTSKRNSLYDFYLSHSYDFATIISKKSSVSKFCNIGIGCIIQDLTNISFNVNLGKNVKVNTGANLMHDVFIGDHSTMAPNCVLLGYVKIGQRCFIGSNSTVLPHVKISEDSILGAGSVATKNLETGVYAGVPARKLK
jgi:sugar O-acyltransferase (sialic acid O-acetyltransferase NeuD family)